MRGKKSMQKDLIDVRGMRREHKSGKSENQTRLFDGNRMTENLTCVRKASRAFFFSGFGGKRERERVRERPGCCGTAIMFSCLPVRAGKRTLGKIREGEGGEVAGSLPAWRDDPFHAHPARSVLRKREMNVPRGTRHSKRINPLFCGWLGAGICDTAGVGADGGRGGGGSGFSRERREGGKGRSRACLWIFRVDESFFRRVQHILECVYV